MLSKRLRHFIVQATDYSDALPRRLETRSKHLERTSSYKKQGFLLMGGAVVDNSKMIGSIMLFNANDKKSVQEWIQSDPYYTSRVWEKVEINEFLLGMVSPHINKE